MTIHTVSGVPTDVTVVHPTDIDTATWLSVTYEGGHMLQLRFPDTEAAKRMLEAALRCLIPANLDSVVSGEVLRVMPWDDGLPIAVVVVPTTRQSVTR